MDAKGMEPINDDFYSESKKPEAFWYFRIEPNPMM
jgi:hypothetical protein